MAALFMIMPEPLIDVTDLSKSYAGRDIVRAVSLRVMPGDIVGLVGANGGGKTTTLRMIAGLLRPDQGQGTVLGDDIRNARRDPRSQIGYMSQRLALYPDLSVAENLRFRAAVYGLHNWKSQIEELATRYGISDVLQTRFGLLSGGWARRVQFAAAVVHAPPLLLLDEPTAGLDAATKRDIWQWLDVLAAAGHAIVVVTHDLAEAARLPKVLFYHGGTAMNAMTPTELIAASGCDTFEAAVIAYEGSVTA
jgi:ABC-2 type transport system ATP-binding protein